MEADVAIQRSTEKWAAGESLYEQPDKVTYIYSNQKKERKAPAAGRFHVKPSKSYDDELEISVGRDRHACARSDVNEVYDDLSLSAGTTRSDRHRDIRTGKQVHPGLQFPAHDVPERSAVKGRQTERSLDGGERRSHKKTRRKQKPHFDEDVSHMSRYRYTDDAVHTDFWIEEVQRQKVVVSQDGRSRPIPIEFHLKEDQLTMSGPPNNCRRPINMSSQMSPLSSLPKEKPSSFVIVEVKDGPTLFYKQSGHMASDSGISDETMFPSQAGASQSARHALPGFSDPYSIDPQRTSSFSAYTGSFSFSNSDISPFTSFRRDSSSGLHHGSSVSIGAAVPSLEDSPKSRSGFSQLPRTPGLRKPDLSVLSTPNKHRGNCPDDDKSSGFRGSGSLVPMDKHEVTYIVKDPSSVTAALPIASGLTMPHSFDTSPADVLQPVVSVLKPDAKADSVISEEQTAFTEIDKQSSSKPQDAAMAPPLAVEPSLGFQNTYEILQQKAGIKHDDIVVGPRRPKSGIMHEDVIAGAPEHQMASTKYDGLGPGTVLVNQKFNLSASTNALTSGHPAVLLQHEFAKRRQVHSESDSFVADGVSTGDSKCQHENTKVTSTSEGDHKRGGKSFNKVQSQRLVINDDTSQLTTSKCPADKKATDGVGGGVESGKEFRPNQRKPDQQKPQHGKNESAHTAKRKALNLDILTETADLYTTKSLDRSHKSLGSTKVDSKSVNVSPAKQQLHSPKAKSSTSAAAKKQSSIPKLHMLSNIPVPMNHDPPSKRHSYHRPPSTPDQAEPYMPSPFQKEIVAAPSHSGKGRHASNTESAENNVVSTRPQELSVAFGQPCAEDLPVPDNQSSAPLSAGNSKLASTSVGSKQTPSIVNENMVHSDCANTLPRNNVPTTLPQSQISDDLTSTTVKEETPAPTEPPSDSPCHLPVKPRLHRSAEHLLGDAKLAVFNSADNVPCFDAPEPTCSRAFKESAKSEKAGGDSISPLKTNHGLAKTAIMRRGSDRTELYRRGSDRAILPVNQNDPSVENLKKATSLKELCQSMASLLNIDNVKAAEMITTSLSQRQDLVEGLDADAILDYLSHHGVLDPGILVGLDGKESVVQRNSAILKHVEEHGNTAVALFINALRQSGQLHLASSLDTEQRIKPVSGNGYFGKDRHKGEITIRIEIEALKIVAPREPRSEKIVDTSLFGPGWQSSDDAGVTIKDDDEDSVKPRSCWCFCFSYKSKIKSMSKKETEKQRKSNAQKLHGYQPFVPGEELKPSEEIHKKDLNTKPHRTKSQEKAKKGKDSLAKVGGTESSKKDLGKTKEKDSSKKSKSSKSKSKVSGKYSEINRNDDSVGDQARDLQSAHGVAGQLGADEKSRSDGERSLKGGSGAPKMTLGLKPYAHQQEPTNKQIQTYNGDHSTTTITNLGYKQDSKESWDPIVMEYNPKLELIKLRAGQDELASPTRQSGNTGIMCEQWKSNGRYFQNKATQLCEKIVQELHTEIIKYFEQDRGTLILDVVADVSSVLIVNICMMRAQVKCLQLEIADNSLLNKIHDMFFSKVDIADFDIRGIKLRIALDEAELDIVLSELS